MSCNSNDLHLHPAHFTCIFQQLQRSHLGLCQQFQKGNWICPSSAPLLDCNSTTVFSCLIPFSIHYLICDAAPPPTFRSRCNDILLTPSIIHCFPEPPSTPEALACLPSPFPYLALRTPVLPFQISVLDLGLHTANTNLEAGKKFAVQPDSWRPI